MPFPVEHLATPDVLIEVIPELGGKITSLVDAATGHEYLSEPRGGRYERSPYGASFEASDVSGWNECFPAIGESPHPQHSWRGTRIPDHGELWTMPWVLEHRDGALGLRVEGVRFPYAFERTIVPMPGGFRLQYRVENRSADPFACIWSTHPLFAATPGTRVLIPTTSVLVEQSVSGRLGGLLDQHAWPAAPSRDGHAIELDVMGPVGQGEADKVYSARLREGWAALHDLESDQWLLFTFSTEAVPYVGYWANRSGWPAARPSFDLALEPCNGFPDRLDVAADRGAVTTLAPHEERAWDLNVWIGLGAEELQARIDWAKGR